MRRLGPLFLALSAALIACDAGPPSKPAPKASSPDALSPDAGEMDGAARALASAEALRAKGDWGGAESALLPWIGDGRPGVRAKVVGKLGRIARSRGENGEAVNLLYEAVALDREAGDSAAEGADGLALAYTLMYSTRSLDEASDVIAFIRPALQSAPKLGAMAPYYEGLIAFETGDYGEALRLFRASKASAIETKQERHRADVAQLEASLLAKMGRAAEAESIFRDLVNEPPADYGPCDRADLLTNAGFSALLVRRWAGEGGAADPHAKLEEAHRLYEVSCSEPEALANALTNLALSSHARGDKESAKRTLMRARAAAASPDARVVAYQLLIEAEQALLAGGASLARAEALYDTMGRLAALSRLPGFAIEASIGRALVYEVKGARADADNAYRGARSDMERWLAFVPFGEGWDTFLGTLAHVTSRWVEALLRRPGGERAAFAAASEGYAQELSALLGLTATASLTSEERAARRRDVERYKRERESLEATLAGLSWSTPSADLDAALARYHEGLETLRLSFHARDKPSPSPPRAPPPSLPEDEAQIVYTKLPRGWIGIAASAGGAVHHDLTSADPEGALAPFSTILAGKKRITVRASGASAQWDLHAAREAKAPIVYGLGLHRPPRTRAPAASAVMVIDPSGDYPALAVEANAAREALERRGLSVKTLVREAATRSAVMEALEDPRVELLYYLGHAGFEGRDGERSALWLAQYGRLTVTDVLAARRVPMRVVLGGCEAGRRGALGIAHAFVMAGAESVVAASRAVDAGFAARFVRGLAEAQAQDPFGDPAGAAASIAASIRAKEPSSDWASFRVFVP